MVANDNPGNLTPGGGLPSTASRLAPSLVTRYDPVLRNYKSPHCGQLLPGPRRPRICTRPGNFPGYNKKPQRQPS
ncbi:hypothetical protein EQV97_05480 [Pseudomonas sp. TMW22090]|nr:hypothetical protein [Pseudomonas sp. TMW22090]